ncbi:YqaE/Pmp3 family membrane protein [Sabulibacter ruber]|uniref:YqaE/Pmp3 family membrane protein n=1 Tax=Sabulibacter ruber TaxID=2811901 RepID=UPI001F61CF62|nr:YqaE/Pmp3 family membrane protein [Sabulibacter ruber]
MKFKSLLQLVLVFLVGQFLLACSSTEYYRFSSVKPESYQKSVAKVDPAAAPVETTVTEGTVSVPADITPVEAKAEPVLEANAGKAEPVLFETKRIAEVNTPTAAKPSLTLKENLVLESAKSRLESMTKAEKKEFKKEVKNAIRGTNEVGTVLKIILAILLPPLAVFLHEGLGSRFWISVLLTLLFILPGIIYALLVVTDSI